MRTSYLDCPLSCEVVFLLTDEEDAASAVDSEIDSVVVGAAASVAVGSGVFEAERRGNFFCLNGNIKDVRQAIETGSIF